MGTIPKYEMILRKSLPLWQSRVWRFLATWGQCTGISRNTQSLKHLIRSGGSNCRGQRCRGYYVANIFPMNAPFSSFRSLAGLLGDRVVYSYCPCPNRRHVGMLESSRACREKGACDFQKRFIKRERHFEARHGYRTQVPFTQP